MAEILTPEEEKLARRELEEALMVEKIERFIYG